MRNIRHKIRSAGCSIILPTAGDKCPVLTHTGYYTGLLRWLVTAVKRQQPPFCDHDLHAERTTDDCLLKRRGKGLITGAVTPLMVVDVNTTRILCFLKRDTLLHNIGTGTAVDMPTLTLEQ